MQYLTLFAVLLAVSYTPAESARITIGMNGEKQEKYVLIPDWSKEFVTISNESSITLHGGGRVYLGNSDHIGMNSYYEMDLFGKRLVFDVDLSGVGCNCNGALYLVSMPAYNSGQQPQPGKNGEYYCDANQVGGTYCPEMDVFEANKYAMASTAHTCQYQAPHYYPSCDRGGCGENVLNAAYSQYGPGKYIDTNKPFTLSVSFIVQNGNLATVNNYFYQEGRNIQFNACNPNYLQWMGKSLPGIVMTMSLWGTGDGGMSWLDGKSGCHGGCNLGASRVTFSNIRIENL